MRTTILLVLLAALSAAGEEKPKTIKALRYRVLVSESALDLMHGGGQWIDELYFPGRGVVANVTGEFDLAGKTGAARWRMHAFPSTIRNRFAETLGGEEQDHPTTEVQVPREVAERIFELADLTRRQSELARKAAATARKAGLFPGT